MKKGGKLKSDEIPKEICSSITNLKNMALIDKI
jgi:hypothetical protein